MATNKILIIYFSVKILRSFLWFAQKNCCTHQACSKTAIKMTFFNDWYVLYCHTYLNTTNYCWKTAEQKLFRTDRHWETVRLYQLFVASCNWESINYLWDWALLIVFGRSPKCQVQSTALGQLGKLRLEISWWKIEAMKNLKRQNWPADCNLSNTASNKIQS